MTTFHCDYCETTEGIRVSSDGGTYVAPSITCAACFSHDLLSFDDLPTVDSLSVHAVALYESDLAKYRAEMEQSEALAHVSDDQLRANIAELVEDYNTPLYHLRNSTHEVKQHSEAHAFYHRELARRAARAPSFAVAAE